MWIFVAMETYSDGWNIFQGTYYLLVVNSMCVPRFKAIGTKLINLKTCKNR